MQKVENMEKINTKATILIIPGLRDHVEEHWQTILATQLEKVRTVPPNEIDKLSCANRVARIQAELDKIQGPVILVAHSAGVLMTIHWAASYSSPKIKGALLVTPPDLNQTWPENYPSSTVLAQEGWSPLPEQTLPFPSIVVASENDHLASQKVFEKMAKNWGSQLVNLGEVGHMNPASGFGFWPEAIEFIAQLDGVE
ncbi:alpha/beta hydrolase [Acinetobacter sp. Marseille-Q1618]|uniref:RBBP9/YdeN family alpha/beta hydrolase n=1 Tax=Acinetobacter sp. Marseille-Q1618 TaxID=2697502 RepID=UPI0020C3D403|nr:alpha/beta hydrolase [Acinetobacter sp. Marseille-Q1618]